MASCRGSRGSSGFRAGPRSSSSLGVYTWPMTGSPSSQVMRNSQVSQPQGVGKENPVQNPDLHATADGQGSADKIAESVDGAYRGLVKGRDEESACEMRGV